mgnify:CR=1 FL=1
MPVLPVQSQGTPVGESSKIVLRLSFKKIKELRGAMAQQQEALIAKERAGKELQAAAAALEGTCKEHQATIAALEAKLAQVQPSEPWQLAWCLGPQCRTCKCLARSLPEREGMGGWVSQSCSF